MNAALSTFTFEGKSPVRTLVLQGAPWFVGKDACGILGLRNITEALRSLDDDERCSEILNTPGGAQAMACVNESGLYALIFKSRKPEAKRFRKWVTSEVLPSIRQSGGYMAPLATHTPMFEPEPSAAVVKHRQTVADRMSAGSYRLIKSVDSKIDALDEKMNAIVLGLSRPQGLNTRGRRPALRPDEVARTLGIGTLLAERLLTRPRVPAVETHLGHAVLGVEDIACLLGVHPILADRLLRVGWAAYPWDLVPSPAGAWSAEAVLQCWLDLPQEDMDRYRAWKP